MRRRRVHRVQPRDTSAAESGASSALPAKLTSPQNGISASVPTVAPCSVSGGSNLLFAGVWAFQAALWLVSSTLSPCRTMKSVGFCAAAV